MSELSRQQFSHGFSSNLFAERGADEGEKTVVIGGLAADETEWAYPLSRRAAQSLWYDLTRLLFPEKSDEVISSVSTMRSMPKLSELTEAMTTHIFVHIIDGGGVKIEGMMGSTSWYVEVNAYEVYRFWAALDTAIHPAGW